MRISDWSSDVCSSDLGGTSGIGLATAQRLAAEGAHVFLTGRSQSTVDAAVDSIGDAATGVRGDVSRPEDLAALSETIKRSEARRVGKECVSTCRSRLAQVHDKKKKNKTQTVHE